jgi:predicted O-linked N-acetylglucosamine transferase (SPINDLY family)
MGVPVVTLPGEKLASRQTLGFLHFMGYGHLAVRSKDEYVERALELVADPQKLREMRHALRPAFQAAPFSDGPKFTATLEAAYRRMWREYVAGRAPEAFSLDAD